MKRIIPTPSYHRIEEPLNTFGLGISWIFIWFIDNDFIWVFDP